MLDGTRILVYLTDLQCTLTITIAFVSYSAEDETRGGKPSESTKYGVE